MPDRQINAPIEEEMRKSYLDYAMSVIVGRALPDIRDGLKPVHRRVLYTMQLLGLVWNRGYKKSARVVGDCMGKFHRHGDSAIYETLVRMVQDFSLRYPLVDGQGNFGSIDGDPAAAMRYTEARMARIAHELLADIDKDTVDLVPNYDENELEPVVLPTRIPNLLVNGSAGIAVGMATNIPPHNLSEVVDALVMLVDDPSTTIERLMKVVTGPDFPTAGYIYGTGGIREAYTTGRGSITLRAKAHAEKLRGGRAAIIISELPYQVNKASLIEKISELMKEKKLEGISEIRDETNREGIRVVLELGRGGIPQIILNQLYKHTQMQTSFGIIMLALVGRRPQIVNLKGMLEAFIRFRREVVTRRTRYDLARAEERAHILAGLRKAVEQLDMVIRIIRGSDSPEAAQAALMSRLELSEIQAKAILDMRLQRLTQLERHKIVEEHEQVLALIEELKGILASDAKLMAIIKQELVAIRDEYGDARRTEIIDRTTDLTIEDLLADEEMVVTITRSGYIKRTHVEAYRSQRRGGKGVTGMETKEEDSVEDGDTVITARRTDGTREVMIATKLGMAIRFPEDEVRPMGRGATGVRGIEVDEGDEVIAADVVQEGAQILTISERGYGKRTPLDEYRLQGRAGKGIIDIKTGGRNGTVVGMLQVREGDDVLVITTKGKIIRFNAGDVSSQGRNTMGVRIIDLDADDKVGSIARVEAESSTPAEAQ